ncbi:MAG TPA: CoB--CoM heterodisulfide reductase iron-sulfur subunit B family protein [Terriglobia bacterium]|nr:CoB--CoM heterodisulfide reductase iron-sulfur subunit B family protein [Terriglobia bacterium]
MEIGYYPGCALHGSSNDYEDSVRVCLEALGLRLRELDDWVCCGATAAHSLNHKLSIALPARNLALAERDGSPEILAPCPMCSMELIKAGKSLEEDARLRQEMSDIVELPVTGKTRVLNLIQVFQRIGLETIKASVQRPLTSIQAACYYGCLLTRPPEVLRFDDCEQPSSMESILEAAGAKTVRWNYKTECCGAGMTMANEDTVLELSHKILSNATAHGANCLVVACPMCHVNLDMKQEAIEERYQVRHRLMVYYLSDLVGLALGLDASTLGIDRHFVKQLPDPALSTN